MNSKYIKNSRISSAVPISWEWSSKASGPEKDYVNPLAAEKERIERIPITSI